MVSAPEIKVTIRLSEALFQRDPEETELGRRIVREGIQLIDKLGVETFTFKKLAQVTGSTEASIYRYFENKHKLLVYLSAWYWAWLDHRMAWTTANISAPEQRLMLMMKVLADAGNADPGIAHIYYPGLHRIVMNESAKAYLTKQVDAENKEGAFLSYKMLCRRIASDIASCAPAYPYPRALASMLVESSQRQLFFATHLPSLTELSTKKTYSEEVEILLQHFLQTAIKSATGKKKR